MSGGEVYGIEAKAARVVASFTARDHQVIAAFALACLFLDEDPLQLQAQMRRWLDYAAARAERRSSHAGRGGRRRKESEA